MTGPRSPRGSIAIFANDGNDWLFGRRTDLWAFGGSAAASLLLLALGAALGVLHADTPVWLWLACVVGVDVAHVWATLYRVYLDGAELRRRPLLYAGTPALCYLVGVGLYAVGGLLFWRVLAYAAVFHFVRQQAGWMALYRARAQHPPDGTWSRRLDTFLDVGAIYAAMLYPLCYWHAHPQTPFAWLMTGDFVFALEPTWVRMLRPAYYAIMGGFCLRGLWLWRHGAPVQWGKVLLVLSTWACWHLGIVSIGSDYAFTVTNVLIHGVPYFVLSVRYARLRAAMGAPTLRRIVGKGLPAMLGLLLLLAGLEEALWDRHVFQTHPHLFGVGSLPSTLGLALLVPLLAVPQATHYVLDAFVWRRRDNPVLVARR